MLQYAIIEISGRQFWVETGKFYVLNRIAARIGTRLNLHRVLLVNNQKTLLIGKPYVFGVKINAIILEHLRSKKTIVYKMQPKKKTRKKQGHRQELTKILIQKFTVL
jgi:large subunit ribosomal protein L21